MRYNLSFVCSLGSYVERFLTFEAVSDETAIEIAREHAGLHALELRRGRRIVRYFEPQPLSPTPALQAAGMSHTAHRGHTHG